MAGARMSVALAIFAKTPSLSLVKTRLSETIGRARAEAFYHLSLEAVKASVRQVDVAPFWAVAEPEGVPDPLWSDFESFYTGDGDLGARQHRVYQRLREDYDQVILIGGDAPQISPDLLRDAICKLDAHDFVIGPACDGGYYLFGGRVCMDVSMWSDVPWSSENTRSVLVERLSSVPAVLPMLTDVDVFDDLRSVVREMPSEFSAEQGAVVDWINDLVL